MYYVVNKSGYLLEGREFKPRKFFKNPLLLAINYIVSHFYKVC
jgi:hypothetical protein